jgi:hypothetical protein
METVMIGLTEGCLHFHLWCSMGVYQIN